MRLFARDDKPPDRDVTPEAQAEYEAELKVKARLGRKIMALVCVMNIIVSFVIPLTGIGPVMFVSASAGLWLTLRGRSIARTLQMTMGFILAEFGAYALVYINLAGLPDELRSLVMYFWLMFAYGTLVCLYTMRSRNIESWFEYAGSYKCRYLGKKFFE